MPVHAVTEKAQSELHFRVHSLRSDGLRDGPSRFRIKFKLVGWGGGGFLLSYADDAAGVRQAMAQEGYEEVRSKTLFRRLACPDP